MKKKKKHMRRAGLERFVDCGTCAIIEGGQSDYINQSPIMATIKRLLGVS